MRRAHLSSYSAWGHVRSAARGVWCRTQASLLFGVTVINSKKAQGLLQDAMTAQGQLIQFRPASTPTIDLPATKNPRVRFDAVTMAQTELDMLDAHMDFRMDTFEVSRLRVCELQLVPAARVGATLQLLQPGLDIARLSRTGLEQRQPHAGHSSHQGEMLCGFSRLHCAFEDWVEQHLKSGSLCPSATGRATPTEK